MRIVFMGTPEFAVPSLQILHENGFHIAGVITATDKYGGRGKKKLIESAVKKYALQHEIPLLQPKNLKDPDFQKALAAWQADLQVVVAFRMLPVAVWDMPPIGTINLHGSLLPAYRGAAPINWAVMNGESETGVTTFFLKHEIDTGDILDQEVLPIGPNDTAGDVHDQMMELGAKVVLRSVQAIQRGDYTLQAQDNSKVSKAPKIFKETCEIDFNKPTQVVHNFIRGLSPYPAAWTNLDGKQLKIIRTTIREEKPIGEPGSFHSDNKNFVRVTTADGQIDILELQLEGRKRMKVKEFLNGYKF